MFKHEENIRAAGGNKGVQQEDRSLDYTSVITTLRCTFESRKTQSKSWRVAQLKILIKAFEEMEQDICAATTKDLGRHSNEAFMGEIASTVGEIQFCLENIDEWMKPRPAPTPLMLKPATSYVLPQPKGVVLNIAPWNYPIHLAIAPLVGALASGCCCVVKPSEITPHCSAIIAEICARLDQDAVRVVEGAVAETTALLKLRWDHIMYTGNGAVARIVYKAASKHLTPVTLELGGKSPVIVDKSVNVQVAARRIAVGKFFNAGQTCVSPDYILCHKAVASDLMQELRTVVEEWYGSNPARSTSLGRIVNSRHHDRIRTLLTGHGGEVIFGGENLANPDTNYFPPTLVRDPKPDSDLMTQEIFGPVLPFLTVGSIDEAVDFVNARERPLALYVFAESKHVQDRVVRSTISGGTAVNDTIMHIANPNLPFGGVGASGIGSYHGKASFDTFSHLRAVLVKPTWVDPKGRYPPYNSADLPVLRGLVFTLPKIIRIAAKSGKLLFIALIVLYAVRRSRR